ncbi:hypothetical protein NDU88_003596 [Pleurodeles waltl]|uniref:Uncharacterized protein n=1 Tax=Pleurodeles waltl TaxID=8319 RepID=A0AAV7RDJ3_PLEWA|nr:hypothetical protein NDU88_003596 [Pleurodeles waltl]
MLAISLSPKWQAAWTQPRPRTAVIKARELAFRSCLAQRAPALYNGDNVQLTRAVEARARVCVRPGGAGGWNVAAGGSHSEAAAGGGARAKSGVVQ